MEENQDIKLIPLSQRNFKGKYAIVDAEDYEMLMQWAWQYSSHGYAVRGVYLGRDKVTGKKSYKTRFMHQEITGNFPPLMTDHRDENRLNNTKANLRQATHRENKRNVGKMRPIRSSIYKGVSLSRRKNKTKPWKAYIKVDGKLIWLGYSRDEIGAAKMYDEAAKKYHGEFARLNFPKRHAATK